MFRPTRLLSIVPLLLLLLIPATRAADEAAANDRELLKSLNLPADGPELVQFFKKRTLREGDRPKIAALIRGLGDDEFDVRERSMADLVSLGALARPLLREALMNPDVEVVRRAEKCLALAERTSTTEALAAAVRQLARTHAAGAAEALLNYLIFVEDEGSLTSAGPPWHRSVSRTASRNRHSPRRWRTGTPSAAPSRPKRSAAPL